MRPQRAPRAGGAKFASRPSPGRAVSSPRLVSAARAKDVARATKRIPSSVRAPKLAWTNVALVVLAVLGLLRLSQPLFVNPTDKALAKRLEQHPSEFANVALQRLHTEDAAMPSEYRASLRRLGLQTEERASANLVYFPASAWWPRVTGNIKGFAFSRQPPRPIVSSLDRLEVVHGPGEHRFYRELGGNWYLYREIGSSRH